jgi:MGT family glycosyltransferase
MPSAKMSTSRIVVLPYPAYGHMTPVLPVVAELAARGHDVTCFTSGEFAGLVRATGARVALYGSELCTSSPDTASTEDNCQAPLRLLTETMELTPAIQRELPEPPDLLVYDTTLWAPGRLLARLWGVPTVQLSATVASNEHFSLTEEGQRFTSAIDPYHPAIAEFPLRLRGYLTASGLGHVDLAEFFTSYDEFTVVFVPKLFQPAGDTFGHQFSFVGPTLDWPQPVREGQGRPPSGPDPVLLVSLGTTVSDRAGFFRACALAFADVPWHVVMTLGQRSDLAELGHLPPNVEAHLWLPHAEVLPHASLFICQGGMGSVMGALYFGVPMVVVPHHPEQHINAARLAELGLARVLAREEASESALREVLLFAADEKVRLNVGEMRRAVREAGGSARAADDIEARLPARRREWSAR